MFSWASWARALISAQAEPTSMGEEAQRHFSSAVLIWSTSELRAAKDRRQPASSCRSVSRACRLTRQV